MAVRVCPERDAVCPHGVGCPFVRDRYQCFPGWRMTPQELNDGPPVPDGWKPSDEFKKERES